MSKNELKEMSSKLGLSKERQMRFYIMNTKVGSPQCGQVVGHRLQSSNLATLKLQRLTLQLGLSGLKYQRLTQVCTARQSFCGFCATNWVGRAQRRSIDSVNNSRQCFRTLNTVTFNLVQVDPSLPLVSTEDPNSQ